MLKQEPQSKRQNVITAYSSTDVVRSRSRQPAELAPPRANRPAFRLNNLDLFWKFIFERQSIWYRRFVARSPPPWTEDKILGANRFTNVYRELDPGTEYLILNVLETSRSDKDKIFNTMLYRLLGRKETYTRIGFQHVETFDPDRFQDSLKHMREVDRRSPFSGAYTVCSYSHLGSRDKVENVAQVFATLRNTFSALYEKIMESSSAQEAYESLRSAYGFGRFLAYQVLVDLLYPLRCKSGHGLLPFRHDDWAIAGPGASRGIQILVGENSSDSELSVMLWLRRNQQAEFKRLGLDFNYRTDEDGHPVDLTLANIQNCLCEFYKYFKIKNGTGRARRRFTPQQYTQANLTSMDSARAQ